MRRRERREECRSATTDPKAEGPWCQARRAESDGAKPGSKVDFATCPPGSKLDFGGNGLYYRLIHMKKASLFALKCYLSPFPHPVHLTLESLKSRVVSSNPNRLQ